jgi:hypothetical protein
VVLWLGILLLPFWDRVVGEKTLLKIISCRRLPALWKRWAACREGLIFGGIAFLAPLLAGQNLVLPATLVSWG